MIQYNISPNISMAETTVLKMKFSICQKITLALRTGITY